MATTAQVKTAQAGLRKIGWPLKKDGVAGRRTKAAVIQFKRGYAWPDRPRDFSSLNGYLGGVVRERIEAIADNNGKCSAHFRYREWKSNGNGWIKLNYRVVRGLEVYRKRVGHGVEVISGYRDCDYNDSVRGAARCSRHSDCCGNPGGDACDLNPELSFKEVKALKRFTGIGIIRSSGLVRHVDVRPGSVRRPTTWFY
ncbi:MAG: hypothetical protein H0W36_10470 [Gemmatimonadetes bacterium]|jgi:hypothetical protein|nr:hypothetical protein [Gemmatimonadota bacterium]